MFLHMFFKPQGHTATSFFLRRLPKKLDSKLQCSLDPDKMATGWGIHIIDGPNWFTLSCLFLCMLFSSAVVAITWSVVRKDLQGGFAIGSFLVALQTTIVGITFQWTQSPHG
jgi:hypothetical protein